MKSLKTDIWVILILVRHMGIPHIFYGPNGGMVEVVTGYSGWTGSLSASVNLPLHHKIQKFSSGTGSPGWSWKKGRKTVVVGGGMPYGHPAGKF